MNIINLTPHDVNFVDDNNTVTLTLAPSGIIPRCKEIKLIDEEINGITINKKSFGEVENLPDPEKGTVFIVSVLVANAAGNRKDLLVPDDVVRDADGRIIGCRALARV